MAVNNYTYFNPSTANDLAKFQGTLAGIQAGNAPMIGVAVAPTSIYNQSGYHAVQDPNNPGYVHIIKDADDSLYTRKWYDQTTGTNFDFSGTQATQNGTQQVTGSPYNVTIQITGGTQGTQGATPTGYTQYPWGPGTVVVDNNYNNTQTTQSSADEKDPEKELTAKDLQEMVDCGIYENLEEAYNAVTSQGYWLESTEASKLGIYSKEDEQKIQTLMDKLGLTREEAIKQLGDKIQTVSSANSEGAKAEIEARIQSMMANGLSRKEAVEYLEELGFTVPEECKSEPAKYSDKDEAKIRAVMEATGCTREEAIEATGVKPKKDGVITSFFKGVGNFFGGIGKAISDGWNSFWDWLI